MEPVAQFMIREVEVVSGVTSLRKVAQTMVVKQVACLVVVDGEKPLGLITEHDLVRILDRIMGGDSAAPVLCAADLIACDVITVSADRPWVEALSLLENGGLQRLPVVDNEGCLIGLITQEHLLGAQQQALQAQRDGLDLMIGERTRALVAERDAAEKAVQENMQFLATMTHELRTPLNGVVGMAELLQGTNLNTQQHEWVTTIAHCGKSLSVLVDDILDFAKLEATSLELEAVPFSLQDLTEEVGDLLAIKAQGKDVELRLRFDVGSYDLVVGDPGRLRQVVTNLCGNAVKFTERGEVVVSVKVEPLHLNRGRLTVAVRDTGIGISLEQQKRLFQAYTQADASISRRFGGTGLGLAISRRLVEAMGGEISVQSVPDEGSCFSFSFEVGLTQDDHFGLPPRYRVRALVVDDVPATNQDLQESLTRLGAQVLGVSDVVQACSRLEVGERFQVAFVRFPLRHRAHRRALHRLRSIQPGLQVVLVTAISDHALALGVAHHGYTGSLTRPVKRRPLRDILLNAVHLGGEPRGPIVTTESSDRGVKARVRLLLAEDNKVNQMVIVQQLRRIGYECVVVADGREAVEAFRSRPWDLILMDCRLPVLDGYEATQAIRKLEEQLGRPHTVIVALTASDTEEGRRRCQEAGMDGFLTKPLSIDALDQTLQGFLRLSSTSNITPMLLDAITELMNIAVGRGAADLSSLLSTEVQLSVPSIALVADDELPTALHRLEQGLWSAVHLGFDGPFQGDAALMFGEASAGALVSALEGDERSRRVLDQHSERTWIEVGNIVLNSVVGTFCNVLGQSVNFEVPYYEQGSLQRLMMGEHYFGANTTLLARTQLVLKDLEREGAILIVLGLRSFDGILDALRAIDNNEVDLASRSLPAMRTVVAK